ncbi:MAG: DNA gyrase inhibitor YacG [Labrys sp. (in: a-proteobacteria)]|jgi:endogenous inhibitor of DNA gyrase (YacG/DUF329 family)
MTGDDAIGRQKAGAGGPSPVQPLRAAKKPCPICGKPPVATNDPFCSPRCQQIDLSRWLTGAYAIPVIEDDKSAVSRDPSDA